MTMHRRLLPLAALVIAAVFAAPAQANFTVGVGDGFDPVTVSLTESCPVPVAGTEQIPIDGGCVTYRSTVTGPFVASFAPNGGLEFTSRADLVAAVAAEDDQVLCGALAPPCP